jgi:hypothetical protein
MDIGQSFSPTQAPQGYGQNGQPGRGPAAPVMDAIKILSFRVPQILGVGSPVAPGLLSGAGGNPGSGLNNSALVNQWLQRFFGQGLGVAGPMPTPSPQDLSAPMGNGSPFGAPSAGGPSSVPSPSSPGSAASSPIAAPPAPSPAPTHAVCS